MNLEASASEIGYRIEVRRDPALAEYPVEPDKLRLYVMGLGLSLAIGLGPGGAVDHARPFVHGHRQSIERMVRVPVIGTLPIVAGRPLPDAAQAPPVALESSWSRDPGRGRGVPVLHLPALELRGTRMPDQGTRKLFDIESPMAVELRRIMIRLGRRTDLDRKRGLMVTSSQRGEGKSLFSLNFSLILAYHLQKRILLVDGDVRRPVQHGVFQVPLAPGFTEALRGDLRAVRGRAADQDREPALHAGRRRRAAIPAGCSADPGARRWSRNCTGTYDIVIIDTPPVVPVSDPLHYIDAVDGVIYLVMAGMHAARHRDAGRRDPARRRRQHPRHRGQQHVRGAAVLLRSQVLRRTSTRRARAQSGRSGA